MQIVQQEILISKGPFSNSEEWHKIRQNVQKAVCAADWPPGSGSFTIYPESGKKSGEGNGVKPIKNEAIAQLQKYGWQAEQPWPIGERLRPGNMDAAYQSSTGTICFEWETGNISSSHRSLNKLCLGLLQGKLTGGFLVVPSRKLYVYLTDRIGNISELEPYFPLWRATPCEHGVLEVIVIEHDHISRNVPKIPKGTDGRSRR